MLQRDWKRSTVRNPAIDFDFELLLLEFLAIVGSKSAPTGTQWPSHANTQSKRISSIDRSNTREFLSGSFLDRYQKQLESTKRGIIFVMEDMHGQLPNNINQARLETVVDVLKTLDTMDPRHVLENSVVECYSASLGPHDETTTQMEFYGRLRKILQPLVQFNFVLKQYYKRIDQKNYNCRSTQCLPSQPIEKLDVLDEQLLSKIESEFSKKQFFELVKAYLRDQQLKIAGIKEICRICECRVNVQKILEHVQYCQRKHGLTQELSTNLKAMQQLTAQIKKAQPKVTVRKKLKDNQQDEVDEAHKLRKYRKILKYITITVNQKRSQTQERMRTIEIEDQLQDILMERDSIIDSFLQLLQQRKDILTKLQKNQCDHFALKKKSRKPSEKSKGSIKYQKFNFSALQQHNQKVPLQRKRSRWATSVDAASGDLSSDQENNVEIKKVQTKNKYQRANKRTRTYIKPEVHLDVSCEEIEQPMYSSEKYIRLSEELSSNLSFKDFEVLGFLGKGAFGKVYLVRRLLTNDKYAMKVIKIYEGLDSRKIENIANQHDIFRKISGQFLVKAAFSFSQGGLHMFFLEYMEGGDFSKLLENEVYLEQDIAKFYIAQIVLAIQHLHRLNIIHRDLKPQNLVLDSQGHLKLTDFGLSKEGVTTKIERTKYLQISGPNNISGVKEDASTNSSLLKSQNSKLKLKSSRRKTLLYHSKEKVTLIGTPDYIAPEIIQRISIDNPTIDWWSLGVIIYEILVGQKPFGATTIEQVIDNILNFRIQWPPIGYEQGMMSPQAHDLIQKLLNKDFTKRLGANSISQIKNHDFFKGINWTQLKHTKAPLQPTLTKFKNEEQDETLRREIEQSMRRGSMSNENEKKQKLNLNNFIRFDLLSEYTLKSGQETRKKMQLQLLKLSKVASKIDC